MAASEKTSVIAQADYRAVMDAFTTELKKITSPLRKYTGKDADLSSQQYKSMAKSLPERLNHLFTQYGSRLPAAFLMHNCVDLGELLYSLKEYPIALREGFARYLGIADADGKSCIDTTDQIRALQGHAMATLMLHLPKDPQLRLEKTADECLYALSRLQKATEMTVGNDSCYWLTFNGAIQMYTICKTLVRSGFSHETIKYLLWVASFLESNLKLLQLRYLPARVSVYRLVCIAYESVGNYSHAKHFSIHALAEVQRLAMWESEDPIPLPPEKQALLDRSLLDVRTLVFKYSLLLGESTANCLVIPTNASSTEQVKSGKDKAADKKQIEKEKTKETDKDAALIPSKVFPEKISTPSARLYALSECLKDNKRRILHHTEFPEGRSDVYTSLFSECRKMLQDMFNPKEGQVNMAGLNADFPLSVHTQIAKHCFSYRQWDFLADLLTHFKKRVDLEPLAQESSFRKLEMDLLFTIHRAETGSNETLVRDYLAVAETMTECLQDPRMIERNTDIITDCALKIWNFCKPLIEEMDSNDVSGDKRAQYNLHSFKQLLTPVHYTLHRVEYEDYILMSTISLRLALLLEQLNDIKHALEVLESLNKRLNEVRGFLVQKIHPIFSFTACPASEAVSSGLSSPRHIEIRAVSPTLKEWDNQAELLQQLACIHTDVCSNRLRLELKIPQQPTPRYSPPTTARKAQTQNRVKKTDFVDLNPLQGISTQKIESRLAKECGKNLYMKTLLMIESAFMRFKKRERQACLLEATTYLQAIQTEETELLTFGANGLSKSAPSSDIPEAPQLVFRTSNSVGLRAKAFIVKDTKPSMSMFAKAAGSGVSVSLNNRDFPGTGTPQPCGELVIVDELVANELYKFATAAFDSNGVRLSNIGLSSVDVSTVCPLPLWLLWSYLCQTARHLGVTDIARSASQVVFDYFTDTIVDKPLWEANPMSSHQLRNDRLALCSLPILRAIIHAFLVSSEVVSFKGYRHEAKDGKTNLIPYQTLKLKTAKRTLMGLEIAMRIRDYPLIRECITRTFNILAPLLMEGQFNPHALQGLKVCYQSFQMIPTEELNTDEMNRISSIITYQIFQYLRSVGEVRPSELFAGARYQDLEEQARLIRSGKGRILATSAMSSNTIPSVAPTNLQATASSANPQQPQQQPAAVIKAGGKGQAAASTLAPAAPQLSSATRQEMAPSPDGKRPESHLSPMQHIFAEELMCLSLALASYPDMYGKMHTEGRLDFIPDIARVLWPLIHTSPSEAFNLLQQRYQTDPAYLRFGAIICRYSLMKDDAADVLQRCNTLLQTVEEQRKNEQTQIEEIKPRPAKSILMKENAAKAKEEDDPKKKKKAPAGKPEKPEKAEKPSKKDEEPQLKGADYLEDTNENTIDQSEMERRNNAAIVLQTKLPSMSQKYRKKKNLALVRKGELEPKAEINFLRALCLREIESTPSSGSAASRPSSQVAQAQAPAAVKGKKPGKTEPNATTAGGANPTSSGNAAANPNATLNPNATANLNANPNASGVNASNELTPEQVSMMIIKHFQQSVSLACRARAWMLMENSCVCLLNYLVLHYRIEDVSPNPNVAKCLLIVVEAIFDMMNYIKSDEPGTPAGEGKNESVDDKSSLPTTNSTSFMSETGGNHGYWFEDQTIFNLANMHKIFAVSVQELVRCCLWKVAIYIIEKWNDLTEFKFAEDFLPISITALSSIGRDTTTAKEMLVEAKRDKNAAIEALAVARKISAPFRKNQTQDLPDLSTVVGAYDKAISMLRLRREDEYVLQALHEVGDLYALHNQLSQAQTYWSDGVDQAFGAIYSCKNWRSLVKGLNLLESMGMWRCLLGGIMAAKLAKYCATQDMQYRSELCYLSATLLTVVFEADISHPKRFCDYALYDPNHLVPKLNLFSGEKFSVVTFVDILEFVAQELTESKSPLQALPVVSLLIHVGKHVCRDPFTVVIARLLRFECLVHMGYIAEAINVLLEILDGRTVPSATKHELHLSPSHVGILLPENHPDNQPYYNNGLSPDDEGNAAYLNYVAEKKMNANIKELYGYYVCCRIELCRAKLFVSLGMTEDLTEGGSDSLGGVSGAGGPGRNSSPTQGSSKMKGKGKASEGPTKPAAESGNTAKSSQQTGTGNERLLMLAEKILNDMKDSMEKSDSATSPLRLYLHCEADFMLSEIYSLRGNDSQALDTVSRCLAYYSKEHANEQQVASSSEFRWRLGIRFWMNCRLSMIKYTLMKGHYSNCQKLCSIAIQEAADVNYVKACKKVEAFQASLNALLGKTDLALVTFENTLSQIKKNGQPDSEYATLVAVYGDLLYATGEKQQALQNYEEAEKLFQSTLYNYGLVDHPNPLNKRVYIPDTLPCAKINLRIGHSLEAKGLTEEALNKFETAILLSHQVVHCSPSLVSRMMTGKLESLLHKFWAQYQPQLNGDLWGGIFNPLEALKDELDVIQDSFVSEVILYLKQTMLQIMERSSHELALLRKTCLSGALFYGLLFSFGDASSRERYNTAAAYYLSIASRAFQVSESLSKRQFNPGDSLLDIALLPEFARVELSEMESASEIKKREGGLDLSTPPAGQKGDKPKEAAKVPSKSGSTGQKVSARNVLLYFESLVRESSVLPFDSDEAEKRILKLHGFMKKHIPYYAQNLTVVRAVKPQKDDITLPIGQVMSQWLEMPPKSMGSEVGSSQPGHRAVLFALVVRGVNAPINAAPVAPVKGEKVDKSVVHEKERKYYLVGRDVASDQLLQLYTRAQSLRRKCSDPVGQMVATTTPELDVEFRVFMSDLEYLLLGRVARPASQSHTATENQTDSLRGRATPSNLGITKSETHTSISAAPSITTRNLPTIEAFLNPHGGIEAVDETFASWLANLWAISP